MAKSRLSPTIHTTPGLGSRAHTLPVLLAWPLRVLTAGEDAGWIAGKSPENAFYRTIVLASAPPETPSPVRAGMSTPITDGIVPQVLGPLQAAV